MAALPPYLLPLSADSADALDDLRRACADYLRSEPGAGAAEILHSAMRRRHRARRLVALGETLDELLAALDGQAPSRLLAGDGERAAAQHVAWLLTSDRVPDAGTLRSLYEHSETFAAALDEDRAWLRATWDVDPLDAPSASASEPSDAVALACVQLALAALWRRCGPSPVRVGGLGAAALTALALAGALSRRDALELVAARSEVGRNGSSGMAALRALAAGRERRATALPLVRRDGVLVPAGTIPGSDDLAALLQLDDEADAGVALPALAPTDDTFVAQIAGRVEASPSDGAVPELARAFCSGLDIDLAVLLPPPDRMLRLPAPPQARRPVWSARPGPAAAPEPALAPPRVAAASEPASAPAAAAPRDDADATILPAIVECAARELGIDPADVAPDATFVAMGADSLLMVNVLRHVEHVFEVTVGMRELFEQADTPRALAELVARRRVADGATEVDEAESAAETETEAETAAKAEREPLGTPTPPSGASAEQHVAWLVDALTARTPGSKALAQRFRSRLADSRASVGFRSATKEMLYPIVARAAAGAHIEDVDGNRYVDVTMGFGTQLFGHEPAFLRAAIQEHLAHGMRLGPRSEDTGVVAELLCELTGADRVAFAATGTEANAAAMRIARAATGRDRVVVFHDAYHGHFDSMLGRSVTRGSERVTIPVSSGVPRSAVEDVLVLDYGSDEALEQIARQGEEIAAVLVEPVQSRRLDLQPQRFLRELRSITERSGALLVLDEILTGLRAHISGAQGVFGIQPDLATYGKVLGGGYPLGAIAGRREVMDFVDGGWWRYGDDSGPETETTFFGGTYIQHPLSMAAARAVLTELQAAGPSLQARLTATTTRLAERLNAFFAERGLPLTMVHFGSQFRFAAPRDLELLFPHLLLNGIYVWEWRNFFLSTAHSDDDVGQIADATERSLDALCAAGCIAGGARASAVARRDSAPVRPRPAPRVSVYYFGSYPRETSAQEAYETLFETARIADEAGLDALWLPERHFHAFGGIFPSPSVLAAALARETSRIRLHAGSVVLPLHNPIRVAEEWSVVDNLSHGRVGIGVASGWHANDFALRPEAFGRQVEEMYAGLDTLKALWRGESIAARSGTGEPIEVTLHPAPIQPLPPLFTAVLGNPDSYRRAGRHDLGIITNLMLQDTEHLAEHIGCYRDARAEAGLDPQAGHVVVLLHTYLAGSEEQARADAREPFCAYLRSSMSLLGEVADSLGMTVDATTSEPDLDYLLERAFTSYCDTRALIGTVESCLPIAERVLAAGVDEIACFVDFGVAPAQLRESLPRMAQLRERLLRSSSTSASVPSATPAPPSQEQHAPLSFAQERMWFTERLHPAYRGYNVPEAIRFDGPLDVGALAAAFDDLVRSQELLRCRVAHEGGVPSHRIAPHQPIALPLVDVVGADEEATVAAEIARESERRFDLARGPLWVARLLRFDERRHVLVLSFHHIVIDLVALHALMRELSHYYAARLAGEQPTATPHRPYAEYVERQRAFAASAEAEADLRHWVELLTPLPPPLELPLDHVRPATFASEGRSLFLRLDPEVRARIDALCRSHGVTPFMCLVAALAATLRAVSGQREVVIGTPFVDQPPAFASTVGLFINTVPLRLDLHDADTFAAVLTRVRDVVLDAHAHARAPFEEVVRRVNPQRDPSRSPIFQVLVEYGGETGIAPELPGVTATTLDVAPNRAPVDLTLYLALRDGGVTCQFEYATALFERETVAAIAATFEEQLRTGIADPARPLEQVGRAAGGGRVGLMVRRR